MLRSKLRIQIESLLIDINEEVFALSEEISKLFLNQSQVSTNVQHERLEEFEKRQGNLFKKINELSRNQNIQRLNTGVTTQSDYSPPQKEHNGGVGDDEYYMPIR